MPAPKRPVPERLNRLIADDDSRDDAPLPIDLPAVPDQDPDIPGAGVIAMLAFALGGICAVAVIWWLA